MWNKKFSRIGNVLLAFITPAILLSSLSNRELETMNFIEYDFTVYVSKQSYFFEVAGVNQFPNLTWYFSTNFERYFIA